MSLPPGAARFAGVVLVTALAAPGLADETAWRQHIEDGKRAGNARDYKAGTESFRRALKEAEAFGPADPRLAETWNFLGLIYTAQLRLDEAVSALRRALEIRRASLGAAHPGHPRDPIESRQRLLHSGPPL